MAFYENYISLCCSKGKTPSGVALELGISKTSVNRWKNGGGVTDANAYKLADYFGISVSELKGEETEKTASNADGIKKPAPIDGNGEKILTNETLGIFLRELSTEDLAQLAAEIALVIAERNTGK